MIRNKYARGFTLIELMIVVVIIAIIAAVAYPSYQQHIQRTRRAVAAGCMMELSQFMERFFTTNMRYDQDTAGNAVVLPGCSANVAAFYVPGLNPAPTPTQYTVEMVPQGAQLADVCGTLTINQAGARSPDAGARPECWR
jgi:type IV pilus assembly protein PilE